MGGCTAPAEQAAPPVPTSVAIALGSVFGSGGRTDDRGGTGRGRPPAAHGSGLIALPPTERKEVVAVAHAGVLWPDSSNPSAQIALNDPRLAPATQAPGAVQLCPSV